MQAGHVVLSPWKMKQWDLPNKVLKPETLYLKSLKSFRGCLRQNMKVFRFLMRKSPTY
jgi:hypothetical protein